MKRFIRWLMIWASNSALESPATRVRNTSFSNSNAEQISFEIHNAVNGKIVVARKTLFNPNGPDKCATVNYIVAPDAPVIEAISTALVAITLERM